MDDLRDEDIDRMFPRLNLSAMSDDERDNVRLFGFDSGTNEALAPACVNMGLDADGRPTTLHYLATESARREMRRCEVCGYWSTLNQDNDACSNPDCRSHAAVPD